VAWDNATAHEDDAIHSLPRRQVNWWAISAGIVMVGYACIASVVFVLWGMVGLFVPGIDYPYPTLAQQVLVLVAGTTSLIGPRVGRVETDERTRLTVSAGQVPT
jgi:membrane protein implicated in regulation of membrane protease activity